MAGDGAHAPDRDGRDDGEGGSRVDAQHARLGEGVAGERLHDDTGRAERVPAAAPTAVRGSSSCQTTIEEGLRSWARRPSHSCTRVSRRVPMAVPTSAARHRRARGAGREPFGNEFQLTAQWPRTCHENSGGRARASLMTARIQRRTLGPGLGAAAAAAPSRASSRSAPSTPTSSWGTRPAGHRHPPREPVRPGADRRDEEHRPALEAGRPARRRFPRQTRAGPGLAHGPPGRRRGLGRRPVAGAHRLVPQQDVRPSPRLRPRLVPRLAGRGRRTGPPGDRRARRHPAGTAAVEGARAAGGPARRVLGLDPPRCPSAPADQVQGVRAAMTHLLGLGHRTVHHITGPADSRSALIRSATWARRLEEAGISAPAPAPGGLGGRRRLRGGAPRPGRPSPDPTNGLAAADGALHSQC